MLRGSVLALVVELVLLLLELQLQLADDLLQLLDVELVLIATLDGDVQLGRQLVHLLLRLCLRERDR